MSPELLQNNEQQTDVNNTTLHELGHKLGLEHPTDPVTGKQIIVPGNVMSYGSSTGGSTAEHLSQEDVDKLRKKREKEKKHNNPE